MPLPTMIAVDAPVKRTIVILSEPTRLGFMGAHGLDAGVYAFAGDLTKVKPTLLDRKRLHAGIVSMAVLEADEEFDDGSKKDDDSDSTKTDETQPTAKPKRKRRTKAQIEADAKAKVEAEKAAEGDDEQPTTDETPVEKTEGDTTIPADNEGDQDAGIDDSVEDSGEASEPEGDEQDRSPVAE